MQWYFVLSGVILRFFAPQGWHPSVQRWGIGAPKKWKFKQILRYKCHTPSHPLYNFHEIFRDCRDISAGLYKNSGKFDQGVTELWVLICGVLQIFSTPGGKTKHQAPTVLEVYERARGPLSPCQIWWGSDFARHRGAKNVDFFVCQFVRHALEQHSLRRHHPEGIGT